MIDLDWVRIVPQHPRIIREDWDCPRTVELVTDKGCVGPLGFNMVIESFKRKNKILKIHFQKKRKNTFSVLIVHSHDGVIGWIGS